MPILEIIWDQVHGKILGFVGCHLFGAASYATSVYWWVYPWDLGDNIYIKLDAPRIGLDSYTQDAGGYVFACNGDFPPSGSYEGGYAGGSQAVIRPNDGGWFEGARQYTLAVPNKKERLFVGIQKYYRRKLQKSINI